MITNKYNLPNKIIELIQKNRKHEYKKNRYSVTEILNSTAEIILKRRHIHKTVIDASDEIDKLFGMAFHLMLEDDKNTEIKTEYTFVDGITLSGRIDKVEEHTIIDYKTTGVYKFIFEDFNDWKNQGMIYAWLLRKNGVITDKLRFIAFLKDWSYTRMLTSVNYPKSKVAVWEYNIKENDFMEIEKFITGKLNELNYYKNKADLELPIPSNEELWYSGTKYAVMKKGGKRALKLYNSLEDAKKHKGGDYIEKRKGEYKKLIHDKQLSQIFQMTGFNEKIKGGK